LRAFLLATIRPRGACTREGSTYGLVRDIQQTVRRFKVRLSNLVGGLAFGALVGLSATASAQYYGPQPMPADRMRTRPPMNFVARPLTRPAGVLERQLEFQSQHVQGTDVPGTEFFRQHQYKYFMNVGAAVGITPNFELQATFLPIELSPNSQ